MSSGLLSSTMHLAAKDLRQNLRNRSAILIAVVVPFVLSIILNLVFGSGDSPKAFAMAVVDLDRGPAATAFVQQVLQPLVDRKLITVRTLSSRDEARRMAEDGKIEAALVLPAGLSDSTTGQPGSGANGAGQPAHGNVGQPAAGGTPAPVLEVIGNVDAPTGTGVARAIAEAYTSDLNSMRIAAVAAVSGKQPPSGQPDQRAIAEAFTRAAAATRAAVVENNSARNKVLDTKTYLAAGMAVFFLFFTVSFGITSLIDERSGGTMQRLLAMPVPRSSLLAAKLVTSLLLGLVSMTVLAVASTFLLGAKWGDPLAVALLICAVVLAATGITAVLAGMARTAEQASSWQSILSTVFGLLGGTFFPISQVGGLATVSLVTPHAWFLRGLAELTCGGGVSDVLGPVAALLGIAVVTTTVGFLRLRKVVAL